MFYVYVYRDPRPTKNRQPVYVGKGCGQRAWFHWKAGRTGNKAFNDWLTHIRTAKLEPIIEVVAEFADEEHALIRECELIEMYGRRILKTGMLFNITDGGLGAAGLSNSPEQKLLLAQIALKRDQSPFRTPEFKAKASAASKANWQDPAYRERMTASRAATAATETERSRKSAATKAAWADPEAHARRAAAIKASRTPELRAQLSASCKALWDESRRQEQSARMKAVLASPEAKAQRGATMRARWADPEQRAAILASRKT